MDERDLINSNRSEEDIKSFMLKKIRTAKHSKFSNQFDLGNSGANSSGRQSSLMVVKGKNNSSPLRGGTTEEVENIPSGICNENTKIEQMLQTRVFTHRTLKGGTVKDSQLIELPTVNYHTSIQLNSKAPTQAATNMRAAGNSTRN